MPYGIRGVANNLQQLASNLFFMSKATDTATGKAVGFGGAVGNLLKGLIGPAGILIAFQGIIAAFDYFSQGAKKSEEAVDSFSKPISKAGSNLKILRQALNEGTISTEEANRAINKANSEYEDLNLKLDENNKLTDDSVIAIDNKILSLERLAKAQAIQSLIETEYSKIASARAKLDADLTEKGLDLKKLEIRKEEEKALLEGKTGAARRKIQRDFLTMNEKQGIALIDNFNKIDKKGNELIGSLMNQLNKEDLFDELFKDKNKDKNKDKRERVTTLVTPDSIKKQVKLGKSLIKAVSKAMGVELGKNPIDLNKLIDVELSDETKALIKKYNEDLKAEMALSDQLGDAQDFISKSQDILGGMTNFMNAQFEREMTIESNKTSALRSSLYFFIKPYRLK